MSRSRNPTCSRPGCLVCNIHKMRKWVPRSKKQLAIITESVKDVLKSYGSRV